jgi:hypothetical protein
MCKSLHTLFMGFFGTHGWAAGSRVYATVPSPVIWGPDQR